MDTKLSPIENKILQYLVRGDFSQGMELFQTSFGPEKIPDTDFVGKCFTELNRQAMNESAYDFMKQVGSWVQRNPEITKMLETAKRIFYDSLIAKGNSIVETARNKLQTFADGTPGMDSVRKELIELKNRNTLENLFKLALEVFKRANEISPKGLGSLTGMFRCHKELRNQNEADELTRQIEEIYQESNPDAVSERADEAHGKKEGGSTTEEPMPPAPPTDGRSVHADLKIDLQRIQDLYSEKRYQEALAALDFLLLGNPHFIPGLLLKSKILSHQRCFRQAQRLVEEALQIDSRNLEAQEARVNFLEEKFKLLVTGGSEFLDQALHLGTSLGRVYFERALACIDQALEICPDDLPLLDHRYTCLVYLARMEEARDARKDIYMVAPNYVTQFERRNRSAFCFLAGYAYFDRETELQDFRALRRELLLPFTFGRQFVSWYCRWSQTLVEAATAWNVPRAIFRIALWPLRLLGKCLRKHCLSRNSRPMR